MKSPTKPGYLYLIASPEQGVAKIGFCREAPELRLVKLQTGNPAPLDLLDAIPGDRRLEGVIHDALRPYCVAGEWFENIDALAAVFDALKTDEIDNGLPVEVSDVGDLVTGVMRDAVARPSPAS